MKRKLHKRSGSTHVSKRSKKKATNKPNKRAKKRPEQKIDDVDLENLRASGLTDQTIRMNGIYTGFHDAGFGLVIPYRDLNGKLNGFARIRLRRPCRDSKGKKAKCRQAKGSPIRAFFPHDCLSGLRGNERRIFITEGEKKALALSQIGATAIGLGGVYSWKRKDTHELIDDLAQIDWSGRDVYIVFDWDPKEVSRHNVTVAKQRLAAALTSAVARVRSVDMPPGSDNQKQGVDDFLIAHDANDFWSLVYAAGPVSSITVVPLTRAKCQVETANGARLVAKHGQEIRYVTEWKKWLVWDGKRWRPGLIQLEALAKSVAKDLWKEIAGADQEQVGKMVTFAKASNSANGIRSRIKMALSEPGIEIATEELDTHPTLLNVQNGTIDLTTGHQR